MTVNVVSSTLRMYDLHTSHRFSQRNIAADFERAGSSTPRNDDALAEEHVAAVNDEQDDVSEHAD